MKTNLSLLRWWSKGLIHLTDGSHTRKPLAGYTTRPSSEKTGQWLTFTRTALIVHYRKRGSASHIVREVREVRERERDTEREREREWDGSDVTLVALKLAMSFALFFAKMCTLVLAKSFALFLGKNLHLLLGLPSWMALSSHFRCT